MRWDHGDSEDEPSQKRLFSNLELLRKLAQHTRESWGALALAGGLLVLATVCQLAGPQILREVINSALAKSDEARILALGGLFVALVVSGFVIRYMVSLLVTRAGFELAARLKEALFRHILSLEVSFFTEMPPGKLLARVESDTESVKNLVGQQMVRLLGAMLTFAGILVVMAWEDLRTTAAVLVLAPVLLFTTYYFIRFVRRFYRESRRLHAEISGFLTEYVQGVEVIRHHGYGAKARARLDELNGARVRTDTKGDAYSYVFWGLFHLCEILAVAAIVAVGAPRVARREMDLGTLVMFIEYLRQVFMPLLMLSEFLNFMQQALVSGERVFGILAREPHERPELPLEGLPTPRLAPAFAGELRFDDVSFAYEEGHDVLHGIDLSIGAGETVALVGPSGGGKSTIASLLMAFHEPGSGRVSVDGVDLRSVPQSSWRRQVGLVLQQLHIFPGSLRENLTVFDEEVADEDIWRALGIVQAHGLASKCGGLEGPLAERGANLSVGERQLVSFARALVKDPPLLVLDEATASVDPVTERRIQESLDRMLEGRAALIIAHRLSTITGADRILVVEGGRIVERGSHDELYAQAGAYRRLFDMQFAQTGTVAE